MTAKKIKQILAEIAQDNRNERLILIEDIMRAKKLLCGLGKTDHHEAVTEPATVFDQLYELDICALQMLDFATTNELNRVMKERVKQLMP